MRHRGPGPAYYVPMWTACLRWIGAAALAAPLACRTDRGPGSDASDPSSPATPRSGPASRAASAPAGGPSSRPSAAAARARAGRARLVESEAGRLVARSIAAHGGLDAWYAASALRFRYDYRPVAGERRRFDQVVDLLSARAYLEVTHPVKGRFAWDGVEAWRAIEGGAPFPARFWALTPYYFVGMPFVLSDPGVNLAIVDEPPEAAGLPDDARVVEATFDPGTGDAPDDYYVLYLSAEDDRLLALRYVVSYAPFLREGMRHTPEKLLVYSAPTLVGGLRLYRRHTFYAFGDGRRGDEVTEAMVEGLEAGVEFDEARLERPPGAVVDRALEAP